MFYYNITATVAPGTLPAASDIDFENMHSKTQFRKQAAKIELEMAAASPANWALAIIDNDEATGTVAFVSAEAVDWQALVREFFTRLGSPVVALKGAEVTMNEMRRLLDNQDSGWDFRLSMHNRWQLFGLTNLSHALAFHTFETIVSSEAIVPALTATEVAQKATSLNLRALDDELARIAQTPVVPGSAQPADYLIEVADLTMLKAVLEPLLAAKYAQGWLQSRRYLLLEGVSLTSFTATDWRERFMAASGGTLVIELSQPLVAVTPALEQLAQLVAEYQARVLVVFKVPMNSRSTLSVLRQAMPGVVFAGITNPPLTSAEATAYVAKQAHLDGLTPDAELTEALAGLQYPVGHAALMRAYAQWRMHTQLAQQYPAYAPLLAPAAPNAESAGQATGDAGVELDALIGLTPVKDMVHRIIANFAINRLRHERHLVERQSSMHMVFTGNPGTAKTTVARLIARILRDNQILRVGELIEVGASDVIGMYVGQTAPKVKQLFARAAGSVLFIDEAYAIAESQGYGEEAIATIVQEMENHRADVLVIFAGYPAEMTKFLDTNPGLRSRIAAHVEFPDYAIADLMRIADRQLAERHLQLAPAARPLLQTQLTALKQADPRSFGNGRTVRNVLEQALFRQSQRLAALPTAPTDAELQQLTAADFATAAPKRQTVPRIGFN
ncbi:AAA family ATPase [Lacticaseibacillus daqingensis]|uniref:AAA family ATPase n=1 Tax=Lacticaseibacillus daqingensis TaxID=2486014 RepID=UPI000F797556|nr:AAA family ATPase [Lacticaseibacillus daqingensis]